MSVIRIRVGSAEWLQWGGPKWTRNTLHSHELLK
jgi:hypothetical protein